VIYLWSNRITGSTEAKDIKRTVLTMSRYLLLLTTTPSLRVFTQEDRLWSLLQPQAENRDRTS